MWHDNLIEIFKESKLTKQQVAERGNLPLKTVARVIKGETRYPTIDTLDRIATALGCTLGDIVAGTRAVIGTHTTAELEEKYKTAVAERDFALAENSILKDEVKALNQKVELLSTKLMYQEEIIALHKIIEQKGKV